jgi:hypothetical protein
MAAELRTALRGSVVERKRRRDEPALVVRNSAPMIHTAGQLSIFVISSHFYSSEGLNSDADGDSAA